jgi:hypothetical protein
MLNFERSVKKGGKAGAFTSRLIKNRPGKSEIYDSMRIPLKV